MRKILKIITATAVSVISLIAIAFVLCNLRPVDLQEKADALKSYCQEHGYNADYGILVDFGRFSLQKRLYVYDFNKNQVVMRSLSGHGSGGNSTIFRPDFSNAHGSHCSSLGHYKIGRNRYMYNRKGVPAFELVGLDKTNSNALNRGILIHPAVGPLSWGCVTLPVVRYHQLSEFLKTQRNMIMWVYE